MILLKMTIFFGVALLVVVEDQKMDMEDDGGSRRTMKKSNELH